MLRESWRFDRRAGVNAVGNDHEFFGRQAAADIKIFDAAGIGDDSLGPFGQGAVDRQLPSRFPRIDAPLAGDDVLYAGADGRLAAISIRRKQPGVNDVRVLATECAAAAASN